jgi:hypothetical protein
MSVARTGLPHTSRTPGPTVGTGAAATALDLAGANGHRTPTTLALPQDRTPGADQDSAAAADARQQVRALVARERSGGPKVTAAAPTNCSATPAPSTSRGERPWTCASSTAPARPAGVASASPTTRVTA